MGCRDCTMAVQKVSRDCHRSSYGMQSLFQRRASQHLSMSLAPVLTAVLNAAFQSGSIPPDINGGLVTPVFKKGDPLDTGNYRPIAVTEPIMRLYAGILNARVVSFTENNDVRAHTQTGFRPGLATQHNLFALQHMIDEAQGNGKQLYTCFLDLKGAYDRVQRPLLWQVLQRLGIHEVMLRAIQSLYEDSGLTIHINGRRGQTFQSVTGVKQGCPMSPTLFGLYMDGLHHYLMSIDIPDVPMLSSGNMSFQIWIMQMTLPLWLPAPMACSILLMMSLHSAT